MRTFTTEHLFSLGKKSPYERRPMLPTVHLFDRKSVHEKRKRKPRTSAVLPS